MAGRSSLDDRLRRARELRDETDPAAQRAGLSKALADSSNLVAAEAAKIVGEFELSGFEPDLLRAYERFLVDPSKTDKGCAAKGAIVETLGRLDYDNPDFYRAGLGYVQVDPGWPSEDTAGNVRGACAFALARSHQLRTITKLMLFVDMLQSKSRLDRFHAAQAICDAWGESGLPLLKLKLLAGDQHPDVLGACMSGMLRLDPAGSIPVIAKTLDADEVDVAIEAAAALGECGLDPAVEALIDKVGRTRDRELRPALLASLGLSRNEKAIGFLVQTVESNGPDAPSALAALGPAMLYAEIRDRVRQAVAKTGSRELEAALSAADKRR